ncbi:MAG: hypothetical protein AAF384_12500 [Pseudomonadota bacterium]
MDNFRLEERDEYAHAPGTEANYNESVYVNGFDPAQKFGGWMRIGNRVNEGYAEAQVCFYLPDGRIACQFQRPEISHNEGFAAGGLSYAVNEPFKSVGMRYEGDLLLVEDPELLRHPKDLFAKAPKVSAAIDYQLEGLSPMHGGEPTKADQQTMYGRDFSLGHFNQHTRTVGNIQIGDETFELDGWGWRDHSWGPRFWTNIYFYRLLIANFGPDRAMMILKITDRSGRTRREGVLMFDHEYEPITDIDLFTEWSDKKDPVRMKLGLRTPARAVRLDGEVMTLAPLRNRRKVGEEFLQSRIAEGFTRWQWDGRTGLGMTEYIELLEDGEPVGYPL